MYFTTLHNEAQIDIINCTLDRVFMHLNNIFIYVHNTTFHSAGLNIESNLESDQKSIWIKISTFYGEYEYIAVDLRMSKNTLLEQVSFINMHSNNVSIIKCSRSNIELRDTVFYNNFYFFRFTENEAVLYMDQCNMTLAEFTIINNNCTILTPFMKAVVQAKKSYINISGASIHGNVVNDDGQGSSFHLLSTEWVDYVEEPMKYQTLRPHFSSVVGVWRVLGVGHGVGGWWWGG